MTTSPTVAEEWRFGDPMPAWVASCTRWNDLGELVLCRRSGDQVVRQGEKILRDLDGEPLWVEAPPVLGGP